LWTVMVAIRWIDAEEVLVTALGHGDVPAQARFAALAAVDELQDASSAGAGVGRPGEETPDAGRLTLLIVTDLRAGRVGTRPHPAHGAQEEMGPERDR